MIESVLSLVNRAFHERSAWKRVFKNLFITSTHFVYKSIEFRRRKLYNEDPVKKIFKRSGAEMERKKCGDLF